MRMALESFKLKRFISVASIEPEGSRNGSERPAYTVPNVRGASEQGAY